MASEILGFGRKESLCEVLELAERSLLKNHGAPRQVVIAAAGIEVRAARHDYEGPFESYAVRLRADERLLEQLREISSECTIPTSIVESDGIHEFRCHTSPGHGVEEAATPITRISHVIRMPEVWHIHGENYRHERLSPEHLFLTMKGLHASDIHMFPGASPVVRIDNETRTLDEMPPLSSEQILAFIKDIAPEKDWKVYQDEQQCSFGYHQVGLAYARVSAFFKAGVPHLTLRFLPEVVPSFEDLHIPRGTMESLAKLRYGLILVTGMTGSGKSTTVASLVDWINANKRVHLLTIEDPVEYVHKDKMAVISQRNVGTDVGTFREGVRAALRHDPDVIFIGEMRDPDTIRSAIDAAATGHLVISTFHANTASEVVNRLVSFFSPVERDLVRLQLRDAVKCIMCQRLLPRVGGGRLPAMEFLFNDTKHIGDAILAGDTIKLRVGMQQVVSDSFIMEDYLLRLFRDEVIDIGTAQSYASNQSIFDQMRLGTYVIPAMDS